MQHKAPFNQVVLPTHTNTHSGSRLVWLTRGFKSSRAHIMTSQHQGYLISCAGLCLYVNDQVCGQCNGMRTVWDCYCHWVTIITVYDSHVTRVTNVSDPVRVLLSLSSAASGSRVTVEQDTHMEHTQHTCQLNQHTCQLNQHTCQLWKHDFNFCNLRFWIFTFWFSIFTKRDFNFLIFNFWIFNFQLFQNVISIFYVSTF